MYSSGRVAMPVAGSRMADAHLYGLLFAGAAGAFCLSKFLGGQLGLASQLLAIMGDATCGWSWLLVRALFRSPGARLQRGPLALVIAMVAIGAVLRFGDAGAMPILVMAENAERLISSTLLLLAAIEPLRGSSRNLPRAEKRFRIGFAASYATVLMIAVLLIDGAPADSVSADMGGAIKALCALAALAGMGFAIWYRIGNPVPEGGRQRRVHADSDGLGDRILHRMQTEVAFERCDLKLADLARSVGEAEYKVTRCITGALGFRNFNHMANHLRVAEAKRRLTDPGFDHLPILTIAMDCGFGSIGPFNRAFKAETGTTPMHFRRKRQAEAPV